MRKLVDFDHLDSLKAFGWAFLRFISVRYFLHDRLVENERALRRIEDKVDSLACQVGDCAHDK